MKHILRHNSVLVIRLTTALVAMAAVLAAGRVAAQINPFSPTEPPGKLPGYFDVLPLNTSSFSQVKEDPLTVNGPFTVGRSIVGSFLNVSGSILWNSDRRDNWETIGSRNFVHLYDLSHPVGIADVGVASVVGDTSGTATFTAKAGTGRNTAGVSGYSAATGSGLSAGVVGETQNPTGYGVYGTVGSNTQAWAGYFSGNAGIAAPRDLIIGSVGGGVSAARTNVISEVCLNGDCRLTWPPSGGTLWSVNGATLWPSSETVSLIAGGTEPDAVKRCVTNPSVPDPNKSKFSVINNPNFTSDVCLVSGTASLGQIVIGAPVSGTPTATTCGDGICNGNETGGYGQPTYCGKDCDFTAPNSVTGATASGSPQVTISWTNPAASDFSGTKVVMTIGTPPSKIQGASLIGTEVSRPSSSFTSAPLTPGTYYFGLYSHDQAGNFATGVIVEVRLQ